MNSEKLTKSALYLSMTIALAACSGGGGGGSGSDEGAAGGKLGLDTNGYSGRTASIGETADFETTMQLQADAMGVSDLIEDVEDEIDSWDVPAPNGNVYTQKCKNNDGTGTVVATIESDDVNDNEHWQFTNCEIPTERFGRVVLNGTYQYVDRLTAETIETRTWKGYEAFDISGSFLDSNEELKILGREDWNELYKMDGFETTSRIDALEFVRGDRYVAVSNATFNFIIENDAGESYSLNANLIGSAIDGYVTLSTPIRVTTSSGGQCPDTGAIRIDGEGYAEIRFGTSTGTGEAAVLKINGSRATGYATCGELGQNVLL